MAAASVDNSEKRLQSLEAGREHTMRAKPVIMLVGLLTISAISSWRPVDGSSHVTRTASSASFSSVTARASRSFSITSQTPAMVDGSQTPELVSDEIAYRHFVMAAAAPDVPTSDERARRAGYLARIGLSVDDRNKAITALATVRDGLEMLKLEQARLTGDSPDSQAARVALKVQRDAILQSAVTRLRGSLSPEGANRVDAFVMHHVKRKIKIYGDLPR